MKKVWTMGVVAAVTGASLWVAAPAMAQVCTPSEPLPASPVTIENGQIRINPDVELELARLAEDASALANDAISCGWGQVPAPVRCTYGLAWSSGLGSEYVYEDPYTGEIVIDYGELQYDANSCL